jgi:hypothetical protein
MMNVCSLTKAYTHKHSGLLGFYTLQDNSLMRRFGEAWCLHLQSDRIWFRWVLHLNETVTLKTDKYIMDPNHVFVGYPHLRYIDSIHHQTPTFCKEACSVKLNAMMMSPTLTYFLYKH